MKSPGVGSNFFGGSRMVKRIVSLSILIGILVSCKVFLAAAQNERFGIRGLHGPKNTEKAVQTAKECGVSWARLAIHWGTVEPEKGKFKWQEFDRIVSQLLGNGIKVVVTIRSYSKWGSRKSKIFVGRQKWKKYKVPAMPSGENIKYYERFVQNLVERYDGDNDFGDLPPSDETKRIIIRNPIKYWQIEAEPGRCDLSKGSKFWNGTAEELARLTMIASDSIRRADPDAKIMLCGFGFTPIRDCPDSGYPAYVLRTLRSNNYDFDVFDIHNYRNVGTIREQVRSVRRLLQRYAFTNVKIWMTEAGFNRRSFKLGVSRKEFSERRAISMVKRHVIAFCLGVEKVFLWKLSDSKGVLWPPKTKIEFTKFRGILDQDLTPKPVYFTYRLIISKLDGFTKAEEISKGSNKVFSFLVNGNPVFVAWSNDGRNILSLGMDKVKITDPFGNVTVGSGRSLNLTNVPVFIEKID